MLADLSTVSKNNSEECSEGQWERTGGHTGPGMVCQDKELEFNLIYSRKPFKDFEEEVLKNHSEGNAENK